MIRAAVLCLVLPGAALGQTLGLPIDCVLGDTCYIQQYVDHDSTTAASDFTCGGLSYDGHDGTDFALPTLADQAAGVNVLAVAPGTVAGARNGEPDILQGSLGAPDVTGRECGNGVLIDHADGLQTQYCHMAQGSIRVLTGDTVVTGTVLGQVGLSGQTQFPHVHLTVRQDGGEVDPFDPDSLIACGVPSEASLFADAPSYQPGGVIDVGFAGDVPDYDAVRAGLADVPLTRTSPAIVLFALIFGGQAGDNVFALITGPDGVIVDSDDVLERTQAILFRAAGLRTPDGGWPAGEYAGTVQLVRDGTLVSERSLRVVIE